MTLMQVVLRGIRHRPGRSVVVLALAAVAVAAAVMTPVYTAAAQQSLLTDALTELPSGADRVRVGVGEHRPEAEDLDRLYRSIETGVTAAPELGALATPVRYASGNVAVTGAAWPAATEVVYRQGVCERLRLLEGDCDTGDDGVLISQRSAAFEEVEVGDTLQLGGGRSDGAVAEDFTVAGIYQPRDAASGYWGLSSPFHHGTTDDVNRLDALFVTEAEATAAVPASIRVGVEYAFDIPAVRSATVADLNAELKRLDAEGEFAGHGATVESRLPGLVTRLRAQTEAVTASVPMVTVPLLLLSWFVLYLVVARLSEERAPQIALAKLRGLRWRSVSGFAVGEAAVLIVAAVPVGVGLGWAVVRAVAATALAPGATGGFTPDVALYVAFSLSGAMFAVAVASRPVLGRSVLALLRRVPERAGWRAGLVEGALVALAVAAVWQVLADRRFGVAGMLVVPLLGIVVGIAVARVLEFTARRRLPGALAKARLGRALALAQLARRPETRRMVVLIAVAVALLTFGVCAWDVSRHNRELTAADEVGAERVYTLSGGDPEAVMSAVAELDPAGEHLMAAMRRVDRYDNKDFTTVAVQSDRLAQVAQWRGMTPQRLERLAAALHPERPDPLRIKGEITVTAEIDEVTAERDPSLVARVVTASGDPETLRLGPLSEGEDDYDATVPECADGCRLIGVGVSPHPSDLGGVSARVTVTGIADADGDLDVPLDDCDRWQGVGDMFDSPRLELDCDKGLGIAVDADDGDDYLVEYAVSPPVLPVALAGPYPADAVDHGEFDAMGPQRELQHYQRAQAVDVVPRGGARAMLVDLEYTDLTAQNHTGLKGREDLTFEVWADAGAPEDLAGRLAAKGLVVTQTEDRGRLLERMSRSGPALSLRLNLVAAGLALLLVVGAVLLSATVGAAVRGHDHAALSLAGVSRAEQRSGAWREHGYWVGFPALGGIAAGLTGLALVLPTVPLVSDEPPEVAPQYVLGPLLPGATAAALAIGLSLVVWAAVRVARRRGAVRRLRDGEGWAS